MGDLIELRDEDYRFISGFLYDRFGIRMGEQKRTLIAGRLSKRLRELGCASYGDYFARVARDQTGAELSELMNLLTTNHSYFYREKEHFDFLVSQVLQPLKARAAKGLPAELRIWSAGCASGEEVYSVAMTVRDVLGDLCRNVDVGILATDISTQALMAAKSATYPESKLRELPPGLRRQGFENLGADANLVRPEVRSMVLFKRLNLMRDSFPFAGAFDVVFCRNVMIYFDQDSRRRLIQSIFRYVKPGGYFFIGHSETIPKDDCPFEYLRPAIYRKAG